MLNLIFLIVSHQFLLLQSKNRPALMVLIFVL